MTVGRGCGRAVIAILAVCASACGNSRPSEADARSMVDSMLTNPLFEPLNGSKVVTTRKDFCGGGSVAPFVERRFSGSTVGVEDAYRKRMSQDGWRDVRDVEAGGVGASKGDRIVHIELGQSGWRVFMQQGSEPASCDDLSRGEEVTSG